MSASVSPNQKISKLILPNPIGVFVSDLKGDFQLSVTESMITFVEKLKQEVNNFEKLRFSIGLIPRKHFNSTAAGLYNDREEERTYLLFPREIITPLPILPEEYQLLTISFKIPYNTFNGIVEHFKRMKTTPGPRGNSYPHFNWAQHLGYRKDVDTDYHISLSFATQDLIPNLGRLIEILNFVL